MWGKGLYFAQDAKYSHKYSHDEGNLKRGMFLAQVNIGDADVMTATDKYLKCPKNGKDSVLSIIEGFGVNVVYSNCKAYPSYCITYRSIY